MTFILLIALIVFEYYAPTILWGTTYKELIDLLNNKDAQTISEITKLLGITEETAQQYAISKIAICVGIFIAGILAIILIRKLLKKK